MLWFYILIFIIAFITLLLVIISFILFKNVIARNNDYNVNKDRENIFRGSLKFNPDDSWDKWEWFKKYGEDIYIKSQDSLLLHGIFIKSNNAKRTIVMVHGYRGSYEGDFNQKANWAVENNCNILCIDQRGCNYSEGKYLTMGINESLDLRCWVDYLLSFNDNLPIYLWGVSMGCATCLMSLNKPYSDLVKGVIADCGYTSPYEIFKAICRRHIHFTPHIILFIFNVLCRLFAGFSLKELDTRKILKENKLPILFIHGLADDFVPCFMSKENYKSTKVYKDLLLVKDCPHAVSYYRVTEEYKNKVEDLFNYCENKLNY